MKIIKKILIVSIVLVVVSLILNIYMVLSTRKRILDPKEISLEDIDCILVLGAGIRNNRPSPMLEDRLITSMELYETGLTDKILVSGDHTKEDYDEVTVMKTYLIENKIPSENIFMDHAGISSYDSIYRAQKIFKANKIIIVTQEYHLYRALYIAKQLGLEAYGVSATRVEYQDQTKRDIREFFARIKDIFKCLIKPESAYLGEIFPITGNGDKTNYNKK